MQYILNSGQMKQCDANTMERYGMLSAVLMERAALKAAEEALRYLPEKRKRFLIVCGTGNNGGDGLAIARLLFLKGQEVTILFPGKEEKCSVEAARQLGIVRRYGIPLVTQMPEGDFDVVMDAIFGIGLDREVGGVYRDLILQMNRMPAWKMAVDISSGISADDGAVLGCAFRADLTVTFGFAKVGQLLYPGAGYTGELKVKDIGIDGHSLFDIRPELCCLEPGDLTGLLPRRTDHSNKGSYGKLLIVAGSRNMAGAAAFSARAAYRTGSGLVKVVTEECNREIIQTLAPEAVLAVYTEETEMEAFIREQLAWADAVAAGPGLGRSEAAEKTVRTILSEAEVPCLLDADALNILAEHPGWLKGHACGLILTPHLGEMSRLTGTGIPEIQKKIISVADQFANEYDVITVLKDARTVIGIPGGSCYLNLTGNHGMATAGAGDVLSGIIGSLLGQGLDPESAAPLGVLLHGMAGDAAAAQTGKRSLMASDLVEGLAAVLREL